MNDLDQANARVRELAARIGRIESRLRTMPPLALVRKRRLRARLAERQEEWVAAVEWQDVVHRYYGEGV